MSSSIEQLMAEDEDQEEQMELILGGRKPVTSERKRRRIVDLADEDEDSGEAEFGASAQSKQTMSAEHNANANKTSTSSIAASSSSDLKFSIRRKPAAVAGGDDDVEILSSTTAASQPRKKLKVPASIATGRNNSGSQSPPPPVLSPVSEPDSPEAPLLSPVESIPQSSYTAQMMKEEENAVLRAKLKRQQERIATGANRIPGSAFSSSAASSSSASSASASASAAAAAAAAGSLRRRKAPNAASSSSLASASLLHSLEPSSQASLAKVDQSLVWQMESRAPLPVNARDRNEVERTLLQQVLVWDIKAASLFADKKKDAASIPKDSKAKSSTVDPLRAELEQFQQFLDPTVPLPVYFTSPFTYLGFFGPIVLENLKSQLLQSVEEKLGPFASQNRTSWLGLHVHTLPTVKGGGDDWFELKLSLAVAHKAIANFTPADIVVVGIDDPELVAANPPPVPGQVPPIPPPSPQTMYVFAYVDHIESIGPTCYIKLRLFLPGVSSSLSTYVAPSSATSNNSTSRFQVFWNRLNTAIATNSNPTEEGGGSSNRAQMPSSKLPQVFYVTQIDNIITTFREYVALVKISMSTSLRLLPELLRPSPSEDPDEDNVIRLPATTSTAAVAAASADTDLPPALESLEQVAQQSAQKEKVSSKKVADAMSHLDSLGWIVLPAGFRELIKSLLNEHQLKAVQIALKRYEKPGFTLLQGPPGTGKSKTIVALLNVFHLGSFQRHYDSLVENALNGGKIFPRPRILVCAPSNTAVDELIMRVVETGVQYKPPVTDAQKTHMTASELEMEAKHPSLHADHSNLNPVQKILATLQGHGGFVDGERHRYSPHIVRIGKSESIRKDVKDNISLDALVQKYTVCPVEQLQGFSNSARTRVGTITMQLHDLCEAFRKSQRVVVDLKARLDSLRGLGHDVSTTPDFVLYQKQLQDNLNRKRDIGSLFEQRSTVRVEMERADFALRYKNARSLGVGATVRQEEETAMELLRISFLNSAQIVFSTLNGAGTEVLSQLDQPFKALIIDEAAQSTEISTLIPLTHDVNHVVLVGDPRQLPATVFSQDAAARRMWHRSLFERLEQSGHQMHALTTQYRMHSAIRQFPSEYFYHNLLSDAPFITHGPMYHQPYHPNPDFHPLVVYDLQSSSARGGGDTNKDDPAVSRSMRNPKEATFVVDLLSALLQQFPAVRADHVGVITFYQAQRGLIAQELRNRADQFAEAANAASGHPPPPSAAPTLSMRLRMIEVSTVDSYQGRESDIIVVSCVRGGASGGLGFVDDVRRMNVALTRAKFALWVVGDSRMLSRSQHWNAFLESASKRKCLQSVTGEEFQPYRPQPRSHNQHSQHPQQQFHQHHHNNAPHHHQHHQGHRQAQHHQHQQQPPHRHHQQRHNNHQQGSPQQLPVPPPRNQPSPHSAHSSRTPSPVPPAGFTVVDAHSAVPLPSRQPLPSGFVSVSLPPPPAAVVLPQLPPFPPQPRQ